jgi:hypothetical protein
MNIMIDLETLSTTNNACIVSIGAIKFDKDYIFEARYWVVESHPGFHVCPDTMSWWDNQSDEAREVLYSPHKVKIKVALRELSDFIGSKKDNVKIWGNGATFDNVILANAYKRMGLKAPWHYRNNRCYRTVLAMAKDNGYKETPRQGTHHHALDDAEHQVRNLAAIIRGNYLCGITI